MIRLMECIGSLKTNVKMNFPAFLHVERHDLTSPTSLLVQSHRYVDPGKVVSMRRNVIRKGGQHASECQSGKASDVLEIERDGLWGGGGQYASEQGGNMLRNLQYGIARAVTIAAKLAMLLERKKPPKEVFDFRSKEWQHQLYDLAKASNKL